MSNRLKKRMPTMTARLRTRVGAYVTDGFFNAAARLGRLHPHANPRRHNVEVLRNVAYKGHGQVDHLLDIYRPLGRTGPMPIILYIHGGGFRILSKDTHWVMALAFARRGYLVFNINYRLAPRCPFPAAVEDCCAALAWLARNATGYGGDVSRLAFAGESAGANLVTALTLATCYRRPEAFAQEVFELGLTPRAVLPMCGMLQVSDPERFARRRKVPLLIMDRLIEVSDAYLAGVDGHSLDLADPLVVLERGDRPDRPLPAFYAAAGTRDPLLDDTRRLKAALDKMGVPCQASYFPGQPHAFHALVLHAPAKRCWREMYAFLEEHHLHQHPTL